MMMKHAYVARELVGVLAGWRMGGMVHHEVWQREASERASEHLRASSIGLLSGYD
jgi:hypothetical protein